MIDWQSELDRTSQNNEQVKKNWRLSSVNSKFQMSSRCHLYIYHIKKKQQYKFIL